MLSRLLRCAAFFCARSASLRAGLRQSGLCRPYGARHVSKPSPSAYALGSIILPLSGLAFFCIQLFVACTQLLCLSLGMKTLGGRKMFKKIGYAQFSVTPARRAELLSPPRPGPPANPGPPPGAVFAWRGGNRFLVCWGR
jgi:hypothetical protein